MSGPNSPDFAVVPLRWVALHHALRAPSGGVLLLWLFVLKPLDEGLDSGALAFVAVLTKEMGGLVDGLENSFAQDDELAACELLFSQRGAF